MKTKVLLREEQEQREVRINDGNKPPIKETVVERWQHLIDIVAEILDVPAALVMRISETHMNVFLKSNNEDNPYPADGQDTLLHGLYCETVIGRDDELHVDNSLLHEKWKDNPDVSLNMISYYGLPLKWNDGTVFGTICALDNKTNQFDPRYRQLLHHFKQMMEQDLDMLKELKDLEVESGIDSLTGVGNRRTFERQCEIFWAEYKRYNYRFGLAIIDLDHFKHINDKFGHLVGDQILKRFAYLATNRIRKEDSITRFGGDEFVILARDVQEDSLSTLMSDLQTIVKEDPFMKRYDATISYGISLSEPQTKHYNDMIDDADLRLYNSKEKHRKKHSSK